MLSHPVIHKHDSNDICCLMLQPIRWVYPPFPLYFFTPFLPYFWFIIIVLFKMYTVQCTPSIYLHFLFAYNGPTNQNNQLWLGGFKLQSKLWFFICIMSCLVLNKNLKYEQLIPRIFFIIKQKSEMLFNLNLFASLIHMELVFLHVCI